MMLLQISIVTYNLSDAITDRLTARYVNIRRPTSERRIKQEVLGEIHKAYIPIAQTCIVIQILCC
jgi:hypothetical protein